MRSVSSRLSADRVAALIFFVVFAAYGLAGASIRSALAVDVVGPAFFPVMVGILGAVLALALLLKKPSASEPLETSLDRPALASAALFLGFILSLPIIGFAPATAIFLTIMMKLLGCPGRVRPVILALLLTAMTVLIFRYLLNVRLPSGWLLNI